MAPGDPKPRSAGFFNELTASARAFKSTNMQTSPPKDNWYGPQDTIRVHNDTGTDITSRFAIVGLVEPIFLPDVDNAAEHCFVQTPCFKIEYPCSNTYQGRFAVLQGPLSDGRVGLAVLSGKFVSLVDDSVAAGDSVDVDASARQDDDSLSNVEGGVAKCIWAGDGTGLPTGTKWGLMRFGGGGSAGGGAIYLARLSEVDCIEQTAVGELILGPCDGSLPGGYVDVVDEIGCNLVGPAELLNGKVAWVTKVRGTATQYVGACHYAIITMCCDSFAC